MSDLINTLKQAGFSGESLRIAWAIMMRESKGNAAAYNGNHATGDESHGLFQINMIGDLGASRDATFRKKVKGYTGPESLKDPLINARAAYYMSGGGKNWYSWDIDKNGYDGGSHAPAFRAWYAKFPGDDGSPATQDRAAVDKNAVPKNPEEIAAQFGASYAWLEANPALKKWFDNFAKEFVAANGKISQARFTAEFNQIPIVKNHSQQWLEDWQLEQSSPEVYQQKLEKQTEYLRDLAAGAGAQLTDPELAALAKVVQRNNFNESQINNMLAGYVKPGQAGSFAGNAGTNERDLLGWASANGLTLTGNSVANYIKRISSGDMTLDDAKQELRKTYLAGAYPAWGDMIAGGKDPADIFAPHLSYVQQTLEDQNITLSDPLMKKITQAVGPDGKPVQIPLYEAERMARQDQRWQKTDNAYQTYANVAMDIARTWGFA